MSRRRSAALSLPILLTFVVTACTAQPPGASPSPSVGRVAHFTFTAPAPWTTWHETASAVTSSCDTPASGSWSFTYNAAAVGSVPGLSLDLSVAKGAATPAGSGAFRLEVDPDESSGLPVIQVDPTGLQADPHGSTGSITITKTASGSHIHVEGAGYARGGTVNPASLPNGGLGVPFTFDVDCPA